MTPAERLTEAGTCIDHAELSGDVGDDSPEERSLLLRAQTHAMLAAATYQRDTAEHLQGITGHLARIGQPAEPPAIDWAALHSAAELIVRLTAREESTGWSTTRRLYLVLHALGDTYTYAGHYAAEALDNSTGPEHCAVTQAIMTLKIELPA